MPELKKYLSQFKNETVAVAFRDLATGKELLVRADEPFHPASTFKVAVMMEVFHQAAHGILSLDKPIPVVNAFTSIADGASFSVDPQDDAEKSLYEKIGGEETLREIVRLMIAHSSNLATNILIQKVTAARINAYLTTLGIEGVEVLRGPEDNKAFALGMNNRATARGLMQLMAALGEGRVVSSQYCDEMIDILHKQEFNEGIPTGLPRDARSAHKTGWNDQYYHDFGLVFPEGRGPYALAVMTHGFDHEADAHACVAEVTRRVHAMVTGDSDRMGLL